MKINEVVNPLTETAIEGLYVRDVNDDQLDEMQALEGKDERETALLQCHYIFNNMVVTEAGEPFDDAQTLEDVRKLGIITQRRVQKAVTEVLNDAGKD